MDEATKKEPNATEQLCTFFEERVKCAEKRDVEFRLKFGSVLLMGIVAGVGIFLMGTSLCYGALNIVELGAGVVVIGVGISMTCFCIWGVYELIRWKG